MTTIGQGVIELSADGSKLKAGVEEAKRNIRSLGAATSDMSKSASNSIDRYVKRLETQASTLGKSTRETELYKLALRGANKDQIAAADSALRLSEAYEKGSLIASRLKFGIIAAGAAAAGASISLFAASLSDLDKFNDLNDATGASIENISALDRVARETGGNFETVAASLTKFNKVLNESGDESKAAGRILKSLGLDAQNLKQIDPAEALRQTAVALSKYASEGDKARAVQELFGKSVQEVAPFLKDLSQQTALVGTTSAKAAQDAENFNKSMFEIKANVQDAARAITNDFLPGLNGFIAGYKEIKQLGAFDLIIKDAAKDLIGLGKITGDYGADINKILQERQRLQKDIEFSSKKGFATRDLRAELDELNRYLELLRAKQSRTILSSTADTGDALSRRQQSALPSLKLPDKPIKASGGGTIAKFNGLSYDQELSQKVGKLLEDSDVIKAKVFSDTFERLDKLFFDGAISADLYDSAVKKLTGSTSSAKDQVSEFLSEQMRLAELLSGTASVALEKQRDDMKLLAKALTDGAISEQQYLEAVTARLNLTGQSIAEATSLAKDLGLTFSSAFEDAIVGGNDLRSVLQGLAKDVLRIAARKTVTEPLGDFFSTGLKSILSGFSLGGLSGGAGGPSTGDAFTDGLIGLSGRRAIGGPVSAGQSYLVGERGPEIFTPNALGNVSPNVGNGSVSVVVNIDSTGTSVDGGNQQATQLGAIIGNLVSARLIQEKRPGGLLAA